VPHAFVIPDSSTGLYWSFRGCVRCREHVTDIDDDRWCSDGWAPIPASSLDLHPRLCYQCQRCSSDGNALGPAKKATRR
jgi:hypothetical protein